MLLFIWLLVLVLALVLYYRNVYIRFSKHGLKYLIPIPILGNMAMITFRLKHFFDNNDKIYKSFPRERFVGCYEFVSPVVFIRDFELVKRVAVKDFDHFVDHGVVVDESIDLFFGKSIFTLKGQQWKDMRSIMSPAFTGSKMRMMIPFMMEASDYMINRIKRSIRESGQNYYDVEFQDIASRYSNDIIATCVFGVKVDSQNNADTRFYELGKEASEFTFIQTLKLFGFHSFPYLMKMLKVQMFPDSALNFFRKLVVKTIRDREANNIYRPDMINFVIEAKKGNLFYKEGDTPTADAGLATGEESSNEKNKTKTVWSNDYLVAQLVLFFMAGFETGAQVMTFLVHELASNPEVQEKLVQEIKENERKNGGVFDYSSVKEMTYLDMVVSEVLRLWTPGGSLDRVCTKDYNMGRPNDKANKDYIIRRGDAIRIPIWSFHRDPQFFPNPTIFDPERFSEENRHNIQPFTYSPFGIGPRSCVASRFALCEVKVMIYQLLQHVEVSPCEKTCRTIKLSPGSLKPYMKGGHWIRLKMRE